MTNSPFFSCFSSGLGVPQPAEKNSRVPEDPIKVQQEAVTMELQEGATKVYSSPSSSIKSGPSPHDSLSPPNKLLEQAASDARSAVQLDHSSGDYQGSGMLLLRVVCLLSLLRVFV
jgi:hypothetical protein